MKKTSPQILLVSIGVLSLSHTSPHQSTCPIPLPLPLNPLHPTSQPWCTYFQSNSSLFVLNCPTTITFLNTLRSASLLQRLCCCGDLPAAQGQPDSIFLRLKKVPRLEGKKKKRKKKHSLFLNTGEGGPFSFTFCDVVKIHFPHPHLFLFPGFQTVYWIRKRISFFGVCFVFPFGRGGRGVCWLSFCIKSIRSSCRIIAGY